MRTLKLFILLFVGAFFLSACEKESGRSTIKDAVVLVRVLDETGDPLAGIPVKLYDEKGYEEFEKNNLTPAAEVLLTDADGCAEFRFAFREWFVSGARQLTFVVQQGGGPNNYRIWSKGRTVEAGSSIGVEFRLGNAFDPTPVVELDMFDENHGNTLLGGVVYIDADRNFVGDDRYSFVDVGTVSGLDEIKNLKLDGFADRIAVQPGHGYYLYKDIALMVFHSGKWGLSIGAEYVKCYVSDWLFLGEEIVGARIHYDILRPEGHGLPAWDEVFEVRFADGASVSIPLPDENGDYEFDAAGDRLVEFAHDAQSVQVRVTDPAAGIGKEYKLRIRNGNYYTEVRLCLV